MSKQVSFLFSIILIIASCKASINPDDLYGKWKYVSVEHTNDPTDSVSSTELAYQAPYIKFTKNNDLEIIWGGKVLSHGKFRIDGYNIRYKESLPDGTTREFPFWVLKITGKKLIFETLDKDGSKVTAVK